MRQVLGFLLSRVLVIICYLRMLSTASVDSLQAASSPLQTPHCPSKCGSIEIPYPFGIGAECAWQGGGDFTVFCKHSFHPPRAYTLGNIEITSISVETGEMHVYAIVASVCYNSSNTTDFDQGLIGWYLVPPFVISPTENVFTAIGCDALAFLEGRSDWSYFTGCITSCASLEESAQDGDPCTGLGCCQTSIPGNLSTIEVGWYTDNTTVDNNTAWEFSPCKHAFVAEKDWYNFSRQDLRGTGKDSFGNRTGDRSAPLVLDWAIRGNGSCQIELDTSGVSGKLTAPACASAHSYCQDLNATRGGGYLCKCSEGYMGNPYIINGCTNINECELRKTNPFVYEELYHCGSNTVCRDTDGNYTCKCKFFHTGDGKSKNGCRPIIPGYAFAIVATFICVVLACYAWREFEKRNKRRNFDENGGVVLKGVGIAMFTEEKLKKITNNYSNKIGKGAYGEVYKGTNDKGEQVAVKCQSAADNPKAKLLGIGKEEFVKEITFQFRISHPNIVRLVGCCLETKVPILVFEFVQKGSLYDVLHGADGRTHPLSLVERLDITIGSAEALSYMHSTAQKNVHGDIKTGNILLNNDLRPKVSDFGSSKLLAMGMYSRSVAADMSYVDPVYIKTGQFTDKSDVYSFGVVLLELITRKTAKYDGNRSLPMDFIASYKDDEGSIRRAMYDKDILAAGSAQSQLHLECLEMIGELAFRCLKDYREERPTMAEVLEELKKVKRYLDEAGN